MTQYPARPWLRRLLARQAGGALGVALLGSLLTGTGHGQLGLALQVPLSVAAASPLATMGLA